MFSCDWMIELQVFEFLSTHRSGTKQYVFILHIQQILFKWSYVILKKEASCWVRC